MFVLQLLVLMVSSISSSRACPNVCSCRWKGGKDTVDCIGKNLKALPTGVSPGTQVLDISRNDIGHLQTELFLEAKLTHLQRLYVAHCSIDYVEKGAFSKLTNLVELDMSSNKLQYVPTQALKDCVGLRKLILTGNPISQLEDAAFASLTQLRQLELSRCEISSISSKAFQGLKGLTHLRLDGNRLATLPGVALFHLKSIHTFDIHGNPWRCDCKLRDLKNWTDTARIPFPVMPQCSLPSRLRGRGFQTLPLEDLACPPRSSTSHRRVEVQEGQTVSFTCTVVADPLPSISWLLDGVGLNNLTTTELPQNDPTTFKVKEIELNDSKQSVLVIENVSLQHAGRYTCTAENNAGKFQANYTLILWKRVGQPASLTNGQLAGIGFGVAFCLATFTLLVLLLLIKGHAKLKSSTSRTANNIVPNGPTSNQQGGAGSGNIMIRLKTSVTEFYQNNRKRKQKDDEKKAFNIVNNTSYNTLLREQDNEAAAAAAATFLAAIKPDVINIQGGCNNKEQIVSYHNEAEDQEEETILQPSPSSTELVQPPRLELVISPETPDRVESSTRSPTPPPPPPPLTEEEPNEQIDDSKWDSYYKSLYDSCKTLAENKLLLNSSSSTNKQSNMSENSSGGSEIGVGKNPVKLNDIIPNKNVPNHHIRTIGSGAGDSETTTRLKNFFAASEFWNGVTSSFVGGHEFTSRGTNGGGRKKRASLIPEEEEEEVLLEEIRHREEVVRNSGSGGDVVKKVMSNGIRKNNPARRTWCPGDDEIVESNTTASSGSANTWSSKSDNHARPEVAAVNHTSASAGKWSHLVPVLPPLPSNQRVRLRKTNDD